MNFHSLFHSLLQKTPISFVKVRENVILDLENLAPRGQNYLLLCCKTIKQSSKHLPPLTVRSGRPTSRPNDQGISTLLEATTFVLKDTHFRKLQIQAQTKNVYIIKGKRF